MQGRQLGVAIEGEAAVPLVELGARDAGVVGLGGFI